VLVPSLDTVRRTVAAESAYRCSRLAVLEAIPGNPAGVAFQEPVDGLVATMARHLPVPGFNAVTGLRAGYEGHIEPLVEWYRDAGADARFELVPGEDDAALGRELARLGYFHAGFHTSLVAAPDPSPGPSPGALLGPSLGSTAGPAPDPTSVAPIEQVTTPAVMEEFLDVYIAGWGIGESEGFKANVRPWLTQPDWRLYLARTDGRPVAVAILYLHEGVGYFADATTHPEFRGRGLQRALLERRTGDALAAGADLVCSGADYLSTSHRNMERAGLRVQFTRALWQALEPPS
jgi:ribosomal protein S18 acetylase RimI-like enzyme